jgi:hypothetical protein
VVQAYQGDGLTVEVERLNCAGEQANEMALHAEIAAALGLQVYFCEKASPPATRTPTACATPPPCQARLARPDPGSLPARVPRRLKN